MSSDFSRGLILDWIEVLDPEIVHVDPLLQRDLLFMDRNNASSEKGTDKSKASASYLRALLSHQSKDTTLLDCVDWLLSVDVISSRFSFFCFQYSIFESTCSCKMIQRPGLVYHLFNLSYISFDIYIVNY